MIGHFVAWLLWAQWCVSDPVLEVVSLPDFVNELNRQVVNYRLSSMLSSTSKFLCKFVWRNFGDPFQVCVCSQSVLCCHCDELQVGVVQSLLRFWCRVPSSLWVWIREPVVLNKPVCLKFRHTGRVWLVHEWLDKVSTLRSPQRSMWQITGTDHCVVKQLLLHIWCSELCLLCMCLKRTCKAEQVCLPLFRHAGYVLLPVKCKFTCEN